MRRSDSNLRLPDFLIIGAMKSGTTSLSADLQTNPKIFFPSVKEPHFLTDDAVLTSTGRRRYARLFSTSIDSQCRGEASTGYTKLPSIDGVPRRAKQLLKTGARFVYLVRNPIDRAISHYYHLRRSGDLTINIDEAIRRVPEFIDYSSYAMQLRAWMNEFGPASFFVVRFEDYVSNRREVVTDICRFLNVKPQPHLIDVNAIHNGGNSAASPRPLLKSLMRNVTRNQWYKMYVHPRMPQRLRNSLKPIVMRKSSSRIMLPNADTLKFLADCFRDDIKQLQTMTNRQDPLWDLDAPRSRMPTREIQSDLGGLECNSSAH
ncbi:MAG: sulfotransferase [Pirellulales bacterium]